MLLVQRINQVRRANERTSIGNRIREITNELNRLNTLLNRSNG